MLGGTITTLTCKVCNNTHGTELDSHLIQMIRSLDSLSGNGNRQLSGWIELAGKRIPTDIDWKVATNGTTEFKMRRNNPALPAQIQQFMSGNHVDSIDFGVNLKYIPCRANLAILRIGYLAMFKRMGYGYILSPAADVIRRMIMDYKNPPTEIGRTILGNLSPAPTKPLQFHSVGNGVAVLLVMTLTADDKPHYYGTPMPRPDLGPAEVLPALCAVAASIAKNRSTPRHE